MNYMVTTASDVWNNRCGQFFGTEKEARAAAVVATERTGGSAQVWSLRATYRAIATLMPVHPDK